MNNYPIPVSKNIERHLFRQIEEDMRRAEIPYAIAQIKMAGHVYVDRPVFRLWRAERYEAELSDFRGLYERARAKLPQPKIWKYQWKPGSKKKCFSEGLI